MNATKHISLFHLWPSSCCNQLLHSQSAVYIVIQQFVRSAYSPAYCDMYFWQLQASVARCAIFLPNLAIFSFGWRVKFAFSGWRIFWLFSDVIIDKEVASGFREFEWMNGFKKCVRKVQSNAEKAWCKFCRCETRAHRSGLNSHYASNKHQKHQRNAVSHYIIRQHGHLLNFVFQKSSDSSNQWF